MEVPAFRAWLARHAYAWVLRCATPFYLWRVWSRGREEPDYRKDWPARLGLTRGLTAVARSAAAGPKVWVHAVSLGEARAAAPLIKALRQQCPEMRLLLTHTTATGREAGLTLLRPESGDEQTWLPYDTPGAVRRFLRRHQPEVGVLMETEVWPVLQHETWRAGVPMVLANARLSDKSLRQGLRLGALMKPAAQRLSAVLAQTETDARRLVQLMGSPEKVRVCGNVKFDMTPAPALLALGQAWHRALTAHRPGARLVMAASTREGEEVGLIQAWLAQARRDDPVRDTLCVVPRHPQRFDEVAQLIEQAGLRLSRRSHWGPAGPDAQALDADVWLGDSMGEMPAYFASADMALLGGSFAPLGGQNLIEAAACGCPIVVGPSTFNFEEATELSLAAGAARRVGDWTEGVQAARAWLDEGQAAHWRQQCLAFAQAHQGAAARMAAVILSLRPRRP